MTRLFSILPGWLWALIVAGLMASQLITSVRLSAERLAHQTSKTQYAERVVDAERQRADLETARRQAEKELADAQEIHAAEVETIRAQLDAARVAGRVGSDRVRNAARATAQLAGQVCADSAAAGLREAADNAARVLADVFGRAEQRASELAGIADERGLAGAACVRLYDEARAKVNAAP